MIRLYKFILFLILFCLRLYAAGPFCPSAPANCSFKNVEEGLKELKEERFFGLLKSPNSVCKGHLMQGIKPEAVLPELMADPRFTAYITPQISQCWKEGGSNSGKLEALSRYAYIQKRFDDNADNLLDYQVFADAVLGNEPLSGLDCKKEAPELARFVTKCQELKSTCKKSDMAKTLAQSFIDDYKSQDIKNIENRLNEAKKIWDGCSPRQKAGKNCQDAKKEMGQTAFRLQVFYANYPWAQEDKFLEVTGKRGFDDVDLVTKALKTQVADNSKNVSKQLKELTTASQCLLRNNCDSEKVNDVLERTKPLADQYFLKKGASKESNQSRAAVSQFVSYNNCLDDMGESQRKTSTTLWSSGIGAVGAIATMGGSLVLTGLTAGGRVAMGAAAVGSRTASVGKAALTLGQAVDGTVTAQSVYEASGHCGSKSTGYFKQAEKSAGPQACGIPTAGQMQFKKEYDGCVLDIILGVGGGSGLLIGLKNANKAKRLAAEADQAASTARVTSNVPTPPPSKPTNVGSGTSTTTSQTVAEAEKAAVASTVADKVEKATTKVTSTSENAAKGTNPLESISPTTNTEKAAPTKLVTDGDYISIQSADNKKQAALVLQTQESATGTLYQVATKSGDGKIVKKWIGQKELEGMKPRLSDASKNIFSSSNINKDLAQSAVQNISRGSPPEKVRALVGKLNDVYDGGEARLKIASKLIGRELNDAEKKWIMAAHNTHADKGYGSIGSTRVRDKINAGEGRPKSLDNKNTRLLMENGIMGSESGAQVTSRAPIPNSRLNGTDNYTLVNGDNSLDVRITQSGVKDGVIYHRVEVPGYPPDKARIMTEDQLLGFIKPKTEATAARVESTATRVESAAARVDTTPTTPLRPESRSLNASAANDIEAINQAEMKTVTNRNRVEHLNGQATTKPERMREVYGTNLGITDANRRAAIAYAPVAEAKTMTSALQKALGADSKVNIKQLRQTMSFNPSSGYVSTNEFANAAKFVEEINAKGGVKALDKLPLSASEREALNAVMARAPSYASYVDPKVRSLGQVKIRKSPVEATNPNRDVVVTDAQGQTVQGKETIRQLNAEGEQLSTVRYTKPDGTETSITVRTSQTMDVAEAQRLQNYDRALTERANANRAARITASEQPTYVNPHGVPRADISPTREVKVKVQTLDGVKEVEAVVQGAPFKGVKGTQEVQVRYQDGVLNGKPVIKYASVAIDEIEQVKPIVKVVETPAPAVVFKPINETILRPADKAIDAASHEGQTFRRAADSEGADILLDRRIGERAHVEALQRSVKDDQLLLREAQLSDRNAQYVSQIGNTSDPRFNPRAFYAHQSSEYQSAMSAPKGSPAASLREQAEMAFKGRISYDASGNAVRTGSARDVAIRTARARGMPEEEIAKLEKWMNDYDQAAPRVRAVERAEAAQKEYEALKPILQKALRNDSGVQIIPQSTFEKMAQSLNDIMLTPEQKKAAEVALKKIRCARPEWKIRDNQFSTFNLKCD